MNEELYLRCTCGDEVLVVEEFEGDYIFSIREMPRSGGIWEKVKMCWALLRGKPNYELVLSGDQIKTLINWLQ